MVGAGHGRRNVSIETTPCPGPLRRRAIQEAVEANMHAYWLSLAQHPSGTRSDGGDLKWAYTGSPVLNRVAGARFDEREADDRIAAVVQRFRAWGAGVTWLTGPSTRPPDLGRRLEGHGFSYQGAWSGMALHLGAAERPDADDPPSGLSVSAADDAATRRAWLDVVGTAFQLPPAARGVFGQLRDEAERPGETEWRRYVGFLDGRPVSAGALVGAAGSAGIYLVGTVPRARQQGFATALTRHVLAQARDRGYKLAVLQATDAGRGLYRRLGFVEYGVIGVYRWSPPRWGQRGLTRLRRLASGLAGIARPGGPGLPRRPE